MSLQGDPLAREGAGAGRDLSYGRPCLDEEDRAAVLEVLKGTWLTQGPTLARFEAGLCEATGAGHAVGVANGTLALELAYAAVGVGPGTRVLVPANTFLATASAAERLGAQVEFVDVERTTGNLDLAALARRLETGPTPDLVVPVHFAGLPCEMALLLELKRAFGFGLIEDASHALGARYREGGRWWHPGEHPEIEAATFSFHPVKPVTSGEGGAILTPAADVATRARVLREHGVDRTANQPRSTTSVLTGREIEVPPDFAPMVALGTNGRLSEMHAALGLSQLGKLARFRERRAQIAARYRAELQGVETLEPGDAQREHAWHLFVVHVPSAIRDLLRAHLLERGIGTQVHYHPVPAQPWYARSHDESAFEVAVQHGATAISLPLHPGLTDEDVGFVIEAVNAVVGRLCEGLGALNAAGREGGRA